MTKRGQAASTSDESTLSDTVHQMQNEMADLRADTITKQQHADLVAMVADLRAVCMSTRDLLAKQQNHPSAKIPAHNYHVHSPSTSHTGNPFHGTTSTVSVKPPITTPLPTLGQTGQLFTRPSDVLDRRMLLRDGQQILQLLVSWSGSSIEEALWVDEKDFQLTYPDFVYENRSIGDDMTDSCSAATEKNNISAEEGKVLGQMTEKGRTDVSGEVLDDIRSAATEEGDLSAEESRVFRSNTEKRGKKRAGKEGNNIEAAGNGNNEYVPRVVKSESDIWPFKTCLEPSVGLGSPLGLEDKTILPQQGIDTAQCVSGPSNSARPTRIKSAPVWATDFVS
ncbi:hypothetical protein OROGR_012087 [Orobanche gracilis]